MVSEEGWSDRLTAERERQLELALGALLRLGEQELGAGRAEHALKAGQRAIALNAALQFASAPATVPPPMLEGDEAGGALPPDSTPPEAAPGLAGEERAAT